MNEDATLLNARRFMTEQDVRRGKYVDTEKEAEKKWKVKKELEKRHTN